MMVEVSEGIHILEELLGFHRIKSLSLRFSIYTPMSLMSGWVRRLTCEELGIYLPFWP